MPQLRLLRRSCFRQVSYAGGLLGIAVLCIVQSWLSVLGTAICLLLDNLTMTPKGVSSLYTCLSMFCSISVVVKR